MAQKEFSPERRSFKKGAILFKEGDQADATYIVESGKIDIFKTVSGKRVLIGSIGRHGIFGELGTLENKPRMAAAIASEDTTCMTIAAGTISQMLESAPRGLGVILSSMAQMIRQAGEDLAQARCELDALRRD